MNLSWRRRLGILKSTARFEKSEHKLLKSAQLTFHDDFLPSDDAESHWQPGFYFENESLLRQYSFFNEKQANNEGRNTFINNSILQIQTRKETVQAIAWHATKGFVEKTFDYSSDVVQIAEHFKQQYGVFRAKLRCTGNVHHACWLASELREPHINLFHFNGNEIEVGFVNNQRNSGTTILGINPNNFYVYSVVWTPEELKWYVNNILVYKAQRNIPDQALSIYFNSFIPERESGTNGNLEVDWVKVYEDIGLTENKENDAAEYPGN